MDSYKVEISPHALKQLDDFILYVKDILKSKQAASNITKDALETVQVLANVAGSLPLLQHPELNKLGYRKIKFRHLNYLMIYKIVRSTARIEAIYHQMQDYENLFVELIEDTQT